MGPTADHKGEEDSYSQEELEKRAKRAADRRLRYLPYVHGRAHADTTCGTDYLLLYRSILYYHSIIFLG